MEEYTIKIERNGYSNILTVKALIQDQVINQIVKDIYERLADDMERLLEPSDE